VGWDIPVNADRSPAAQGYLDGLNEREFVDIETWSPLRPTVRQDPEPKQCISLCIRK